MPDIVPPTVPPTETQPSQTSIIAGLLNPYANVNIDEALKLKNQYGAELEKTRGALSQAQGKRQDITSRNLSAIDEAIKGINESRTGTYGLDPSVTAAMAAGFLNPKPGGNFFTELGGAMGQAAPVVAGLQKQDRDSYGLLAELHRRRGEYEAEPLKEEQAQLREREKTEMANLKEAEKALTRAPAAPGTAAKTELDREKFIEQLKKDAEAEIKQKTDNKMKKDGTPLNEGEAELIRGYVLRKRIEEYNRGKTPDKQIPLPIDDIQRDQAIALLNDTSDMLKGKDLVYHRYTQSLPPGQKPMSQEEFEASIKGKAANAEAIAKSEAALETSLPSTIKHADTLTKNLNDIINHPGLEKVVNPNTGGIAVVSNEGRSFLQYMKVLEAESFMNGIKGMAGTGPISDAEGKKVAALMGRIGLMQTPEEFKKALREIQESIQKMKDEAVQMQGVFAERSKAAGRPAPVGGGSVTGQVKEGTIIQGPPDANGARTQHVFRNGAWDPPIP